MRDRRANCSADILRIEKPAVPFERDETDTPQSMRCAGFEISYVGPALEDDFRSRRCVGADRHLVRHRSAGDEKRRFFSKKGGDAFFQPKDGGVVTEDVVVDFRRRDGLAHSRAGTGNGVGTKVDGHAVGPRG